MMILVPKCDFGHIVYRPENFSENEKYPVIIFFHGIGERGDGSEQKLQYLHNKGVPAPLVEFCFKNSIVLFAGQCPASQSWPLGTIEYFVNKALSLPYINASKAIIAGLSLGGGAVARYINASVENAKKFIGAINVCGVTGTSSWKNVVDARLPIQFFHAADDGVVKPSSTENAVSNIISLNPSHPVEKTIWPTGGHAIWNKVFALPQLQEWIGSLIDPTLVVDFGYSFQNRIWIKLNAEISKGVETFSWKILKRPEEKRADFNDVFSPASADAVNQGIKYLSRGVYTIQLTGTDKSGNTKSISKDITVI